METGCRCFIFSTRENSLVIFGLRLLICGGGHLGAALMNLSEPIENLLTLCLIAAESRSPFNMIGLAVRAHGLRR